MTVRVVVAEDQALVRAGLRGIIETADDLYVLGEAADGERRSELARVPPSGCDADGHPDAGMSTGSRRLERSSAPRSES